ncbi:tail fiber domain-containing protein [Halalkalibacter kiskunsagensis]|uniref:Tail fiber domain-containing protein n=1 Tax=Halalkalibacter kiskunsagensis TaxID=1548599 RepID=A0ABV6KCS3_9BACI
MNRRNFLVNFLLWILSFFFGYKIATFRDTESTVIMDDEGNVVSAKLDDLTEKVEKAQEGVAASFNDLVGRGINIKNPPAPLIAAKCDGVSDDTEALREIIKVAEEYGAKVIVPGVSVISGELEIKRALIIEGIGSGLGYANYGLTKYEQTSGFLVKGNGKKRIRTRVKYRASALQPQDDPLSVAINIQSENVVLRDLTVFLDFNREDNSPRNYGADWDVGIFLGCRVHNQIRNVHVLGYWNEASIWYDVTRGTNLSEFKDLEGNPYPRGTVTNGADGLMLESVFTQGGKWGMKVQGANPKNGESSYSSGYYDEGLGKVVVDRRGNFGASDLFAVSCSFYGTNHHTKRRRDDTTGDYLTDPGGGAVLIDGLAGNSSGVIQGLRFVSCRFSTWEPYRIKLDRVNRAVFIGCHSEGGSDAYTRSGRPLNYDDTDYYGPISTTANTKNVVLEAFNTTLRPAFLGSADITNIANAGVNSNRFAKGLYTSGDIEGAGGLLLGGSIIHREGEIDLQSASQEHGLRFRRGNTSSFYIGETYTMLYSHAIPNNDGSFGLGSASRRWSQIFASTGAINTSDRNDKQQINEIPDKVLDAWSEVNYTQYKFNDAVKEKGAKARWHFGVIAQEIEKAFKRHGLNAFDYGILCYDKWDDVYEDVEEVKEVEDKETGELTEVLVKTGEKQLTVPAGKRYGVRPDECMMLESALMRRKVERLEARLNGH